MQSSNRVTPLMPYAYPQQQHMVNCQPQMGYNQQPMVSNQQATMYNPTLTARGLPPVQQTAGAAASTTQPNDGNVLVLCHSLDLS